MNKKKVIMSYVRIYVHAVWATKYREPLLHSTEIRIAVWKHILDYSTTKKIVIDHINDYAEHCHVLLRLARGQNIADIIKLLKGESSHWINQQRLCTGRFEWQNEYFSSSVSESVLDRVREYIRNQEEHHSIIPFHKEYEKLKTIFLSAEPLPNPESQTNDSGDDNDPQLRVSTRCSKGAKGLGDSEKQVRSM